MGSHECKYFLKELKNVPNISFLQADGLADNKFTFLFSYLLQFLYSFFLKGGIKHA
jgi:hypothetical protein